MISVSKTFFIELTIFSLESYIVKVVSVGFACSSFDSSFVTAFDTSTADELCCFWIDIITTSSPLYLAILDFLLVAVYTLATSDRCTTPPLTGITIALIFSRSL